MAKNAFNGINGVARKVKQPFIVVDSAAHKIKNGYTGVDGVSRQFFQSGISISGLAVGNSVYLNESGVSQEYLIVHHGNPDTSLYDGSCKGTWLLRKHPLDIPAANNQWDASSDVNRYDQSDINTYLNNNYLSWLDNGIKEQIKTVKIPFVYNGANGVIYSGANGLSTKAFLLSANEAGCILTDPARVLSGDGAALSYFNSTNNSIRITYDSTGTAVEWWTRSTLIKAGVMKQIWYVKTDGTVNYRSATYQKRIRPAFILPSTALVDSNFNVIA